VPIRERLIAAAGVIGPCVFIADWAILGARAKNYSPVSDAISELARMHAPTRPAMTAGFLVFAAALPTYAFALRRSLPGQAWKFAAANGVATLGVATFSLGTPTSGDIHGAFAGLAYASLAATPIAASVALRRRGNSGRGNSRPGNRNNEALARTSIATGLVCAAALVASVVGPDHVHGLLQRVGLTIGDVWIIASAISMMRDSDPTSRPAASAMDTDPAG
jgi:hypothetical membrane protein